MEKTAEQLQEELDLQKAEVQRKEEELKKIKEEKDLALAESEQSRKNTLAANERLSNNNLSAKEELEKLRANNIKVEAQILENSQTMAAAAKEVKEAKLQNTKNAITQELEKSGFVSATLLLQEFDVENTKIENGKIVGFSDNIKDLKTKYPNLYVDNSAGNSNLDRNIGHESAGEFNKQLDSIAEKLKEGKTLTAKESALTIFGNTVNRK